MFGEKSHGFKSRMTELIALLGALAGIVSLSLDNFIAAISLLVVAVVAVGALYVGFRPAVIDLIKRFWSPREPQDRDKAVFVYGSLLHSKDLERTIGSPVPRHDYTPALLGVYEKAWSVASTRLNMVDQDWGPVKRDKFLWLNIKERSDKACTGAVVNLTKDEFTAICSREGSYRFENVATRIQTPKGRQWRYGDQNFALIRSKGDQALFSKTTQEMKSEWKVPANRPLADFPPTIILKAKDFATEITIHNSREHNMNTEHAISAEHIANNEAVRNTMLERGIRPEKLPAAEDVKKGERRLASEEKKTLKNLDALDA